MTPDRQSQAVKSFVDFLAHTYEGDYGDFMRETNAHLLDLKDELSQADQVTLQKLQEMQNYTQFNANWEIESTRLQLLQDAEILLNHVSRSQPTQSDDSLPLPP